MASMDILQSVLNDNTMKKYYVEYMGYRFNHMSHGIIALYQLGAPEGQLQQFVHWYQQRLEKPDKYADENDPTAEASTKELLGARKSFYILLDYYGKLLEKQYGGCLKEMVAKEFPKLVDGTPGAALHGMIHLGYGYSVGNRDVVVEGFASIHHSYQAFITAPTLPALDVFGQGRMGILEVLNAVKEDTHLKDYMINEVKKPEWAESGQGAFGNALYLITTTKADALLRYVEQIKLPSFFDPRSHDLAQLYKVMDWVIQCAVVIYATSVVKNNFFLLHGVTGSWSLGQLLPAMEQYKDVFHAVKVMMCALVGVYLVEITPALCELNTIPEAACASKMTWGDIIKLALSNTKRDEHIFKLIQVCHEMDKLNESNEGGKSDEASLLYKTASLIALNHPLVSTAYEVMG